MNSKIKNLFIVTVLMVGIIFLSGCVGKKVGETTVPSGQESISQECELPASDVLGKDISDIPRYPGSVRISHKIHRYEESEKEVITASYVTSENTGTIANFYATELPANGWEVDINRVSGAETHIQTMKGSAASFLGIMDDELISQKYPGCIQISIMFDPLFHSE